MPPVIAHWTATANSRHHTKRCHSRQRKQRRRHCNRHKPQAAAGLCFRSPLRQSGNLTGSDEYDIPIIWKDGPFVSMLPILAIETEAGPF